MLAFQRYGRGKALALTPHDTWLWQMHADVPLEDQSHERFWRQLLRSLVDGVGEPVGLTLDRYLTMHQEIKSRTSSVIGMMNHSE